MQIDKNPSFLSCQFKRYSPLPHTPTPPASCFTRVLSLEVLPCRINNLTMDSSAEYGHIRPSPLSPLGMGGAQQSALQQTFGPVPPPYVSEAEAMLDKGIQTMEVCVVW